MQQKIKRYNITLRDHVQLLGYRGQIELIGKDLGLHGIVFNAPDGSVKVIAEGEENVFDVFFDDLKRIREGVDIETKEVSRDTDLPVPFSRVATDETLEYMKRFDRGIELLGGIDGNTRLLVDSQYKLLEGQNKVISLLEKIESKLK
ncbi:MAG: acylphosphatase [Candidatus Methanoperedens sp.]